MTLTLCADGLTKSFGGATVFRAISLTARQGLIAVTGKNGSGKSTLLKILAGVARPSLGSVRYLDNERALSTSQRRRAVGWAAPEIEFPGDLTAAENLSFLARAGEGTGAAAEIETLLGRVGLEGARSTRVGAYSSGMKQRLRLAFSLLTDPSILLWDEPFTNLDEAGVRRAADIISNHRRRGLILLATNDRRDLDQPDGEISLS